MNPAISISSIPATLETRPEHWSIATPAGALPASTSFGGLMTEAMGQMNSLENQAHSAVTGFLSGTGVDVHQAVIATQKVEMAFELALSVRNKAVQAYQSVMGMQF